MSKAKTSEEMEFQNREIEVLKISQHPNLIKLVDLFESESHYYIIIELCEGGDLYEYLDKRNFKIPESRALHLSK